MPKATHIFSKASGLAATALMSLALVTPAAANPPARNVNIDKTISADNLLASDVKNIANKVGRIKDLIMDVDNSHVRFVIYRVPGRLHAGGPGVGFAELSKVETESGGGDTDVLLIGPESERAPETLKLTRKDLRKHSVDRMLGNTDLQLSDGKSLTIADLRIDPSDGRITHYVVELDDDAVFFGDPRAVPVGRVSRSADGWFFTAMTRQEIDRLGKLD
ncbi:hypothetical protein [Zhongshania sp.]|jgi:sporulation protein YlmC with PRC-barrel domain|uniref:hypothetical protein n=1 Tax=Zhongshania sp. TaxID=1971902 RepID=UPI002A80CF66|nr:hypothetical protein [Zhongshania sp.]